jgi:hypothetical protein
MVSDIITYGLLVSIFIVNGLRMFIDKPNRISNFSARLLGRPEKTEHDQDVSINL